MRIQITINQRPSSSQSSAGTSNFLYMAVKDLSLPTSLQDEDFEFAFSIFDHNSQCYLSERYVAHCPRVMFSDVAKLNMGTIFSDLNASPSSDLCLHVQVLKIGKMLVVESKTSKAFGTSSTLPSSQSSTSNARFKRPFVATIINFSEILKPEGHMLEKEFTAKWFSVSNECDFRYMIYCKRSRIVS